MSNKTQRKKKQRKFEETCFKFYEYVTEKKY